MEAARDIAGLVGNSGNKLMLDSDALLLNRESSATLSPSLAAAAETDLLCSRRSAVQADKESKK